MLLELNKLQLVQLPQVAHKQMCNIFMWQITCNASDLDTASRRFEHRPWTCCLNR